MDNLKAYTADLHYNSSRNERYGGDLNDRVEAALEARFGEDYLGMDGGAFIGGDSDDPTLADNVPMVTVSSREELDEAFAIVSAIVERPVEMTIIEPDKLD